MPSPKNDVLTHAVIGAAIEVHRRVGRGLLESAYQLCLVEELRFRGIPFEREVPLSFEYRSARIENAYRMDFLVAGRLIVEVKAVSEVLPVHEAQLLTYMQLAAIPVGLLLNFHEPTLRDGLRRLVLGNDDG